ncbi:MAG: alpha-L-arabinofuranosidase C-terminal domain-containing protein [Clostridia bacterium]
MKHIRVAFDQSQGTISKHIYGHFAEHIGGVFYDGLWVGEDSKVENVHGFRKALVDSFKQINPPNLRWPGGCFAETYDWRDGIGPREQRPTRVNWWYSHDHRLESNHVGTHEFMELCGMLGAEPYVAANMTSLTPMHIRNWMEYCNFPAGSTTLAKERGQNGHEEPFNVKYWGIGNENWGGGGQMSPEMCAREFVKYATVCNSLDKGGRKFIFCGPNGHDVAWTRRVMQEWARNSFHEAPVFGMSVHYYCSFAGDPLTFNEDEWYQQLFQADRMRQVLDDHRAAMDEFDPDRKIGMVVDEWGCWHPDGSGPSKGYNLFEQQSTMRDAVVAAMTLNIFNERCDYVAMANVAQLCNNLHSLYLAGGEHFVQTPNYYVFDMFKTHQDAKQLHVISDCGTFTREGFRDMPQVSASASQAADGSVTVTLANLNMTSAVELELSGIGAALAGQATITTLADADVHAHNTFEQPERIVSTKKQIAFADGQVVTLPAGGIVSVVIR